VGFSFRRFDHHRIIAPPQDIAHALERNQEWHDDQTSRDEARKGDQIPNCRSSAQLPPNTFLSATTNRKRQHEKYQSDPPKGRLWIVNSRLNIGLMIP
jgi:hypothetical protein